MWSPKRPRAGGHKRDRAVAASPTSRTLRWLFRAPVYLYHWRCGWLLGNRFLLLIHIGRRTGLRRETVLEVVEYRNDGPEAVVISGFGPAADWLRNIAAMPNPEVVIGSHRFAATYRVLGEDEAVRVIESYEHRHPFVAPIIRAVLSRLVGWSYTGSKEDRRKVARQLPFIAFRSRG